MRRGGLVFGCLLFAGFCAIFAACSADDSNGDSADGSTPDGAAVDGASDGSSDGPARFADGGLVPVDSGASSDAATFGDGACTPRGDGGPFVCGGGAAGTCTDSTSQYCIYGPVPNTCQPVPAACQCEETFTCDCLAANLICDDGGARGLCTPHTDGGMSELADAASSAYFWIDAHHCSVR